MTPFSNNRPEDLENRTSASQSSPLLSFPFHQGREQSHVQGVRDEHSAWMNLLNQIPVLHEDLLYIVLNYFCVIGCHEAAEAFIKETGAVPEMPLHSVALRKKIYYSILDGHINEALEGLNQIDLLILDLNPDTNFKLKQQQLNKIIDQRNDEDALLFAQRELAPCVNKHPHLLHQLEESMLKLAFPDVSAPRSVSDTSAEREELARAVDDCVLRFYGVAKESVLKSLLKYLVWSQIQILEKTPGESSDENKIPPIPFLISPATSEFVMPQELRIHQLNVQRHKKRNKNVDDNNIESSES